MNSRRTLQRKHKELECRYHLVSMSALLFKKNSKENLISIFGVVITNYHQNINLGTNVSA